MFGYKGLVFATISIAGLSVTVWAHHMFVHRRGAAAVLLVHDVPHRGADRREVLQLDRHDVAGQLSFDTPMLWALGFLMTFLFGGLTGVILASPPIDFHVTDSYFVVAHFHYVVFGTVVFAMFGGFYFWWPKMTGKMLDERLGKIHFLDAVHRLPHHVPGPALAGRRGHAAPVRRLSARRRLHHAEHGLDDRLLHARAVDVAVPLQRLEDRRYGQLVEVDDPWGYGRFA